MSETEKESALIDLIEANSCLFDKKDPNYKNRVVKNRVWETIAAQLDRPIKECMTKWDSLRSQYLAHQRKLKTPSGSAAGRRPFFCYEERMKFVCDVYAEELTFSNLSSLKTEGDQECIVFDETEMAAPGSINTTDPSSIASSSRLSIDSGFTNKPKKQKLESKEEEMLRILKADDDNEFAIFGRFVAAKLQKIHRKNKKEFRDVQHFICTLLHDSEEKIDSEQNDE